MTSNIETAVKQATQMLAKRLEEGSLLGTKAVEIVQNACYSVGLINGNECPDDLELIYGVVLSYAQRAIPCESYLGVLDSHICADGESLRGIAQADTDLYDTISSDTQDFIQPIHESTPLTAKALYGMVEEHIGQYTNFMSGEGAQLLAESIYENLCEELEIEEDEEPKIGGELDIAEFCCFVRNMDTNLDVLNS